MCGVTGKTKGASASDAGQSLVEFALVMLFVIIPVTFGIIDGSILLYKWVVVNNAAREGARAGAIYHYPGSVPAVGTLGDVAVVDAGRASAIEAAVDATVGPLVSIEWDEEEDWDITYQPDFQCVPPEDHPPCALYDVYRTGGSVQVTIIHRHQPFVGLVIGVDEIDLTATATMRIEPGGPAPTPTP
jgi:hypothetical protein